MPFIVISRICKSYAPGSYSIHSFSIITREAKKFGRIVHEYHWNGRTNRPFFHMRPLNISGGSQLKAEILSGDLIAMSFSSLWLVAKLEESITFMKRRRIQSTSRVHTRSLLSKDLANTWCNHSVAIVRVECRKDTNMVSYQLSTLERIVEHCEAVGELSGGWPEGYMSVIRFESWWFEKGRESESKDCSKEMTVTVSTAGSLGWEDQNFINWPQTFV